MIKFEIRETGYVYDVNEKKAVYKIFINGMTHRRFVYGKLTDEYYDFNEALKTIAYLKWSYTESNLVYEEIIE